MEPADRCERCEKPRALCVCDRVVVHAPRTRVVLLQHPQEQDRELGTAPLVLASLKGSVKVVGLSWASLAHCLGEERAQERWAVLYPGSLRRALTAPEEAREALHLDRRGEPRDPHLGPWEGLLVLDGSWSQAKTLWWRNPWFLKLGRVVLHPREPSIYGKLRREPRRGALSTLEAVAEALVANGEPEAQREDLRRLFRTLVQRARDAGRPRKVTGDPPGG
ncbi:MAG: DTW domain-containing protein [Deltaproteobacteria bacterium]|nr:DTW domain-containing protein [Deltaproteobacteria bacterium]